MYSSKMMVKVCMLLQLIFFHEIAGFSIDKTTPPFETSFNDQLQNTDPGWSQLSNVPILDDRNNGIFKAKSKKWSHRSAASNLYPPDDTSPPNEDYASYDMDYVNPSNFNPSNFSALIYDSNPDSPAIFPNPEMMVYDSEKPGEIPEPVNNEPDILPEVELPDDSLADGDLRERDLIDSVQYVYFGRGNQGSGGGGSRSGRWGCAVPGGAAVGAAAIAITAVTLLRHKTFRNSKMFPIEMNILSCFMVTNVLFIIGIGDTKSEIRCEITALLLHYLHLVCASWIFVYCYVISDNVTKGYIPNLRYNYLFAYGVPAVLVMFFYAISIESYETKDYCWMSLEKGMLLGFMLPGTVLILINTLFAMIGLKAISKKQQEAIANTIQSYLTQTVTTENVASNNNRSNLSTSNKYLSTNSSLISLDCTSRKNTEERCKSELDMRRYKSCDDLDDQAIPEGASWVANISNNHCSSQLCDLKEMDSMKNLSFKIDLSSLSIDNLSWKTTEPEDMSDMRKCLNFALIMQPLFCVFWFMGVVALENSDQILPPFIFAFLWSHMHWFIFARFAYVLPYIPYEECCMDVEEVSHSLQESNLIVHSHTKSTDTIPLLVTKVEVPRDSRESTRPPDSISTISN
ncbi:uncharacterized protein LOC143923306 isoform X1 [Arctopsyche grandis]|uniref:uncharacterized protein LOC143923306 isoform X1 n=1 Tax=Arctopsyche grandis TaxID=121162 RepID=UPI00406D8140